MRTKTVYNFSELSEEAKEKAIQAARESEGFLLYDWYDFVFEDAKQIGQILGISIDNIYFSGFSSQGDGACIEGGYSYEKGSAKAIREHAPKDTELHQIADDLQAIQKKYFYCLSARVKHSGHYYHPHCTEISVYDDRDGDYTTTEASDAIEESLRDFMNWIYKHLESEYDWLNSDEQISEFLANEYEFNEDGSMA